MIVGLLWHGVRVSWSAPDDATGCARDGCSKGVAHGKLSQGHPAQFSWRAAGDSIGGVQARATGRLSGR